MRGAIWQRGWTLLELMLVLALAGLMLCSALALWREQMRGLHLNVARQALAQNARFLEGWRADRHRYADKASSEQWPALPVPTTGYYLIRFSGQREYVAGRYRLVATSRPELKWLGDRWLLMDQNGEILVCHHRWTKQEICN